MKKLFKFDITKKRIMTFVIILLIGIVLIGIDQYTKYLAVYAQDDFQKVFNLPIINKLFSFDLIYNTGAFSGIFSGNKVVLVGLSSIGSIIALFCALRFGDFKNNLLITICIILMFAGTFGNLIDRAFYEKGVVDFINFNFWKRFNTFNIADSYLTIGAILLAVYIIFFYKEEPLNKDDSTLKEEPNDAKN